MKFTRELKNEMIYDKEPKAGINPGLVSGVSYTDSKGNTRNKYQVLTTFSNKSINKARPVPEEKSVTEPVVNKTPQTKATEKESVKEPVK